MNQKEMNGYSLTDDDIGKVILKINSVTNINGRNISLDKYNGKIFIVVGKLREKFIMKELFDDFSEKPYEEETLLNTHNFGWIFVDKKLSPDQINKLKSVSLRK